jgi:DNA mismatch repair protein MLH3
VLDVQRQCPKTHRFKDNCAYFIKEEPVPAVSQRLPTVLSSEQIASAAGATYFSGSLAFTFDETSTWGLKRGDLSRMKVINQLDRKFIVCVLDFIGEGNSQTSDLPKRMLVLVDQHAASERVRVEGFLKTLCHHFLCPESSGSQSAFLSELNPPRPVLLSRREASILCRDTKCILRRWGFDLSWPESESRDQNTVPDAYEQVLVHSIPQVAGEKVREDALCDKRCSSMYQILVGDELRHFLTDYATEFETSDVLPTLGSEMLGADQDGPAWHKALRWCPRSLLEIINSRACRGSRSSMVVDFD